MPRIILSTLNARYIHASLGLRYLQANMDDLEASSELREYTINQRCDQIAEDLLAENPEIIGFGVYIWNTEETRKLIALLKTLRPEIIIVLGGPEVSYETDQQSIVELADYVITGQADLAFTQLCGQLLARENPTGKIIEASPPPPPFIQFPYEYYSDSDLQKRVIYVEASRGCPFKCEFCLSSLDKTATPFNEDAFLQQMQQLFDRGARHFKFVDRTFNLKISTSLRILEFFLDKLQHTELYLHFELIPDRLPEQLKAILPAFPAGSLQFEIGVQSLNPEIQMLISRKQDNDKTCENLLWLRENTHAHIHADLIFGLPGEDLSSFSAGFNKLYALRPHEIQLGILKRLRGTPIDRHTVPFGMRYNPEAPYEILQTDRVNFCTVQQVGRVARYWDLIGNSGRFESTTTLIAADTPFENFIALSEYIYREAGRTHKIALRSLFELLWHAIPETLGLSPDTTLQALESDWQRSGLKGRFRPMDKSVSGEKAAATANRAVRQQRHLAS